MALSASLQQKVDLLKKWDEAYHSRGESLVSDEKYDLVKDYILRELPPDSPELKELLAKVGHKVSSGWKKERHVIAMGSQNKVSNVPAIEAWYKDVLTKLNLKSSPGFVLQHKVDGFSAEMIYEQGNLVKGITRGDGVTGENVTPNVKRFRFVPHILSVKKNVIVRGEGHFLKASFTEIQPEVTEERGKPYKNARNAASGVGRRFDGRYCEYIQILAYDVNATVKTETEKIDVIKKLGFKPVNTYYCKDLKEILKIYQDYKDGLREKLPYEIDGLVLKLDSIELQERMGVTNNKPDGQIALKFNSDQAITKLKEIVIQVGRTGKLTPVGILEPVDLMGSTITRATLHNFAYIEENFISPGAEVTIEKKGDIIPQVVDIITPGKGYTNPTKCPSCGTALVWDENKVSLWCEGTKCRERSVSRILYWIQSINMKGFSRSFVEKLWDNGKIKKVSDLYSLIPDDMTNLDGLGAKTVKEFFNTLENTKEMYLEQFITALGIPGASKGTAEDLVANFKDWEAILKVKPDDMLKIPGYAKISSETVCLGISEIKDMAAELLKVIKIKAKKKGTLTGVSLCVTGSLESMSRKEFEDLVVEEGGSFKSSISVGLNYLVTNTPDSGSGKNSKVIYLNKKMDDDGTPEKKIKIITEKDFCKIAHIEPKKDPSDKEDKSGDSEGPSLEYEPLFG
jgi:DNA ligase (NAD+)